MFYLVVVAVVIGSVIGDKPQEKFFEHYSGGSHLDGSEFTRMFMDMDRQPHDNKVSVAEFSTGWRNANLHNSDEATFYFSIMDVNGDGFITSYDTQYMYQLFLAESDHSSYVSKDHFTKTWEILFEL